MKRLFWTLGVLLTIWISSAFAALIFPFSYAEQPLNPDALQHVAKLQSKTEVTPENVALQYLYFGSDYESAVPARIKVASSVLDRDTTRVRVYDPNCQDDSVHSSIHRIYLRRNALRVWEPFKVDFSHRGRGRFGWTTEPTS